MLLQFDKYRYWISGTLLLLYLFISVPVQLWHQHETVAIAGKSLHKDSVQKDNETGFTDGCSICSHKYADYNDDCLKPFYADLFFPGINYPLVKDQISTSHIPLYSNKSPPSTV